MDAVTYIAQLLVWSVAQLVWQAALACAIFSAWTSVRKPSAEQRHVVAIAMLASLPVLLVVTAAATHASLVLNALEGSFGAASAHSSASLGKVSAVFEHAAAALPVLIVIWCAGAAISVVRLIGEWREIRALSARLQAASPDVAAKVEALAMMAGIAGEPRVLVGDFASGAPFVAGVKRPLLVLPAVELSEDEWDAVILHELAHIRRHDYAVNRAVQLLSALLWFHPSVRMLARWASEAREQCCDTEAARLAASPVALARGLVRIAEHETGRVRAVAATSGALIHRVQRVLTIGAESPDMRRSTVAPLLAAFAIYAAGLAMSCIAAPAVDSLAITGASADALPAQRIFINAVDPAGRFTLTELNGRVASATIAGVAVDRRALRVNGEQVTVLSAAGKPALALNFDPNGAVRWTARRPVARTTSHE